MRLLKVTNAMQSTGVGGPAALSQCALGGSPKITYPVMGACPMPSQGHGFLRPRPHRIPTTLGSGASTPQKTHGQNGIIGHSAARLILWLCSPYKLFAQVGRADGDRVYLTP